MNKTVEIVNELSSMFLFLNDQLNAKLTEPVFTLIPNSGRSRYYGWYWKDRWVHGTESIPEINIAPDFLNRSISDIAETMIHEMVHYKNMVNEIKDCNTAQYHNKNFKKQAEEFGLKVEKMRNRGYALTSLDEKAKLIVDEYASKKLKGKNPFSIHRIKIPRTVAISNKRLVSIDKELAETIEEASGTKLSLIVDQALREWVRDHS